MKKLLLSLFVLGIAVYSSNFCFNEKNLLEVNFHQNVNAVETYTKSLLAGISNDNVFDVGFCYISKMDKNSAKEISFSNDDCIGMAIELDATKNDLPEVFSKLNFKIISKQNISGLLVFDGVSSLFKTNVKSGVNVQIALGDNFIKIGAPSIMGSF